MTITLNGRPQELPAPLSLSALLQELGLANKPVVVELNGEAILSTRYPSTTVDDAARLEIVTLAAGG